jgi:hypothetical protein
VFVIDTLFLFHAMLPFHIETHHFFTCFIYVQWNASKGAEEIAGYDSTIASLQSSITSLETDITQLNASIAQV